MMEKYEIGGGAFLKITKISNGTLRNIIVLGGRLEWRWGKLADCYGNLVGK